MALTSQSSTSSSITKTVCFRAICKSHQSYWFAVNISFESEDELESRTKGRDPDEEEEWVGIKMKPLVILSSFFVVLVALVDLVGVEVDVEDLLARTREIVRG